MNIIGANPPPRPITGDLWVNVETNKLYVYREHLGAWEHVETGLLNEHTVMTKEQFNEWAAKVVTS